MSDDFEIVRATTGAAEAPRGERRQLAVEPLAAGAAVPYVLPQKLATAVNVALSLDQPMLVTGEPGCGKTTLADAVAAQLGTEVYRFFTKSTSVARDLLYSFDSLRRFHDASAKVESARDAGQYVRFEALGRAIRSDHTVVVLIDEIDKAPRDFPNDLLNELDRKEFTVQETGETFRQRARHFILVTSNGERRLPDAFLRRCVSAHIAFPPSAGLEEIVRAHLGATAPASFVATAVRRFEELRGVAGLGKRPATSELLAWVRVLRRMKVEERALASEALHRLPALEVLIKTHEDLARLESASRA